jgi:ATP-dependent DNA helicase DinG
MAEPLQKGPAATLSGGGARPLPALLGPGGALAQVLPGYEARPAQLEMATMVEQALAGGRALVVEAGTGTGKTLAYLLPAAQSGLKVVVSTATKNLQEQLAAKDVPLLHQLGVDAKVAFMKGRQNYLCLLRKEQHEQNPTFAIQDEAAQYEAIRSWAETTAEGAFSELTTLPESAAIFRELASTAESCTGQKCPHYDRCFVFKMRRNAADADVVVVNHHLFFADLALRSSSAGDQGAAVLPHYDAVIFDEAHAVEEVATEHFGVSVSSHRVAELGRDVLRALGQRQNAGRAGAAALANRLLREGGDWFSAAMHCRPPEDELRARAPAPARRKGLRAKSATEESSAARDGARWVVAPGSLAPAEDERQALLELLRALGAELSRNQPGDELQLLERRCSLVASEIALFTPGEAASTKAKVDRSGEYDQDAPARGKTPEPPATLVRWAEARSGHLFLHASPLDVAALLQDRLYDRIGPVVFTSATLAVGGALSFFERRIGLRDEEGPLFPTDEAVLASPFDYETHAALYLPKGMPDPQDPGFAEAVARELRGLVAVTSGRAFALFTSLRNMRAVHGHLEGELAAQGLQVLLQGEKPKRELLRMFKERPSVLFASQSFWEGVDVPGEALQLVVIDKLPFASPSEPLVAARIDRLRALGDEPFFAYQLPEAALALKQGFGRLIRTARDRGVVAVLDPRMSSKSYGRTFLATLPRCRVLRALEDVAAFWSGTG